MPHNLLISQMLRLCFNAGGQRGRPAPAATVRIIGLDGRVTVHQRRVKAAELMREHACHLVCRSDSIFIGQRLPALSAADELQLGHTYFLLPSQLFQSVLTFVTVASSLAKGGGGSLRHFDIHRTVTGKLQIRIGEEEEEEEEEKRGGGLMCTTAALEKEYNQLVASKSRQWKPNLAKIAERPERRRVRRPGSFVRFLRKMGG